MHSGKCPMISLLRQQVSALGALFQAKREKVDCEEEEVLLAPREVPLSPGQSEGSRCEE